MKDMKYLSLKVMNIIEIKEELDKWRNMLCSWVESY